MISKLTSTENEITNAERYQIERDQQVKQRRLQILTVARELFLQNGIEQTTMQELAKAVGISKMTLYRYFPDRPSVAIDVAIETLQEIREHTILRITPNITSTDLIKHILLAMVEAYEELEEAYRFLAMFDNLYYAGYEDANLQEKYTNEIQHLFGDILNSYLDDEISKQKYAEIITIINIIVSYLQRIALRGNLMSDEQLISKDMQIQVFRNTMITIINQLSLD